MKKLLLALGLSISLLLTSFTGVLAGASVDQQYTGGTGSLVIDGSLGRFGQTFKPTFSILDKVSLELTGIVGSKSMTISIRHRVGVTWDTGDIVTSTSQTVTDGWNTFDFADQTVTVSDNDSYGIYTSAVDGIYWKYSSGPSTYSRGYAIWQSNDKPDWDWNFKTWGLEPTEIVAENTQADSQGGETTIDTGTAPSSNVSASIEKPTNLKAEYLNGGKLTWTASSTSAIDGYLVFRSETKGKSYTKIGQTAKSKVEYLDTSVVASKTYYYVVRAYKGTSQSASSTEASLLVPATAGPSAPQNFKVTKTGTTDLSLGWDKNPEANVTEYVLTVLQNGEIDSTYSIAATETAYVLSNLVVDTEYTLQLQAKVSAEKISAPTELTAKTMAATALDAYDKKYEWGTMSWVFLGLAIILGGLLAFLIIKRKRAKKFLA